MRRYQGSYATFVLRIPAAACLQDVYRPEPSEKSSRRTYSMKIRLSRIVLEML
jgi:hypothetical protein